MNKKIIYIVIIMFVIALGIIGGILLLNNGTNNDEIPTGYISVFHGGSGEIVYETYIYKEDNGHDNSGFNYINVTKTTKSYGSSDWNTKITKKGSLQWTDDVFVAAKENNAYSYVTLPNSDKTYTIEEYMNMFVMD